MSLFLNAIRHMVSHLVCKVVRLVANHNPLVDFVAQQGTLLGEVCGNDLLSLVVQYRFFRMSSEVENGSLLFLCERAFCKLSVFVDMSLDDSVLNSRSLH